MANFKDFLTESKKFKEGDVIYKAGKKEFKTAAQAINYVFSQMAKNDYYNMQVEKVKKLKKAQGLMGGITEKVLGSMTIKGPASYKSDARMKTGFK